MGAEPGSAALDFSPANQARPVVLDTNIVLDAFVFNDPAVQPLKLALASNLIRWLATPAMREELVRVLGYPRIMARLAFHQVTAAQVLVQFDGQARMVEVPAKASVTCRDPDDQKFIDLAVAHQSVLLSKDQAVLCMAKRLSVLHVRAQTANNLAA